MIPKMVSKFANNELRLSPEAFAQGGIMRLQLQIAVIVVVVEGSED
jgi:hypothetical protein